MITGKIKKGQVRKLFKDSCISAIILDVSADNITYLKSEFYGGFGGDMNKNVVYDCKPDFILKKYPLIIIEGK